MVLYDKYLIKRNSNPVGSKIKNILNEQGDEIIVGKTTRISLEYGDILKVEHSGNKYHDFMDIDYILYKLNIPHIEELKSNMLVLEEMGNPNYFYVLKIQL